jgi:succinate dehydrogenase / fumarate reductase, iron-sulfur subunit
MAQRTFKLYRYDPDKDAKPYMQTIQVEACAARTR